MVESASRWVGESAYCLDEKGRVQGKDVKPLIKC